MARRIAKIGEAFISLKFNVFYVRTFERCCAQRCELPGLPKITYLTLKETLISAFNKLILHIYYHVADMLNWLTKQLRTQHAE